MVIVIVFGLWFILCFAFAKTILLKVRVSTAFLSYFFAHFCPLVCVLTHIYGYWEEGFFPVKSGDFESNVFIFICLNMLSVCP